MAMKMARSTRAISTPMSSTRCWSCEGTANFAMIRTKTKRLSTLSDFSVMNPAKNSPDALPSPRIASPAPKSTASTIQTIVQIPASLVDTSWGLRPMKKSTAIRVDRPTMVRTHTVHETSTAPPAVRYGY